MKAPHEHPSDPKLLGWIFAAAQAGCGVAICCECKSFLHLKRDLPLGAVSHGYCGPCLARAVDGLPVPVNFLPETFNPEVQSVA